MFHCVDPNKSTSDGLAAIALTDDHHTNSTTIANFREEEPIYEPIGDEYDYTNDGLGPQDQSTLPMHINDAYNS